MSERTCNLDAERMVLGGLMTDPHALELVTDGLKAADFYTRAHQVIYTAICQQDSAGKPFDVVSLSEALTRSGRLVEVGGTEYLARLASEAFTTAAIEGHAEIVHGYAIRRALMASGAQIQRLADADLSPEDALDSAQSLLARIADQGIGGAGPVPLSQALTVVLEDIDRRFQSGAALVGRSTGLADLDRMTGGLEPGMLAILAGRPSMGKSALALTIALSIARQSDRPSVLFWSGEMSAAQVTRRALSAVGDNLPLQRLRNGQLRDDQGHWPSLTAAVSALNPLRLHIDDMPGLSVAALRQRARRIQRAEPLGLIVVDYLQLLAAEGENRTQEVSAISRGLKVLAKECNAPVLALSQLNRSLEQRADRRPTMADIRESGQIEQDADLIWMLYRDEIYDAQSLDKGCAELLIRKNRDGETGMVPLKFDGEFSRFGSLSALPSASAPRPKNDRTRRGFDE